MLSESHRMSLVQFERRIFVNFTKYHSPLSSIVVRSQPQPPLVKPTVITRSNFHTSLVSWKKGKQKPPSGKQKVIDELLDEIEEDDEEDVDEAESFKDSVSVRETELRLFLSQKSTKNKKPAKGSGQGQLKYEEFMKIVDGEMLWQDLSAQIEGLKNIFLHQLSVRSATSIGKGIKTT